MTALRHSPDLASAPREEIDVHRVRPEEVPAAIELLVAQEFTRGQTREDLARVVTPPWPESGGAWVVTASGRVVGIASGIFSTRLVDGRPRRFLQVGTWYVDVGYRRHSAKLLHVALRFGEDATLVALSASPHVSAILERTGFETVSRRRLFYGAARLAFLRPRVEILDGDEEVAASLSEEHRRIHRDHQGLGCGHYVIRAGERSCYVVTKPRREKGWFLPRGVPHRLRGHPWPVSGVLFVSDPQLAVRHFARLRRHVTRRERTVGLVVEESFLGGLAPAARSRPRLLFVHGLKVPARAVDALYSELALLS